MPPIVARATAAVSAPTKSRSSCLPYHSLLASHIDAQSSPVAHRINSATPAGGGRPVASHSTCSTMGEQKARPDARSASASRSYKASWSSVKPACHGRPCTKTMCLHSSSEMNTRHAIGANDIFIAQPSWSPRRGWVSLRPTALARSRRSRVAYRVVPPP